MTDEWISFGLYLFELLIVTRIWAHHWPVLTNAGRHH
jgi:hypothetical protein